MKPVEAEIKAAAEAIQAFFEGTAMAVSLTMAIVVASMALEAAARARDQ